MSTTSSPQTLAVQHLAINGGPPVRASFLPYGRQSIEDADIAAVVEVLRSDWLTTGPRSSILKKLLPPAWVPPMP